MGWCQPPEILDENSAFPLACSTTQHSRVCTEPGKMQRQSSNEQGSRLKEAYSLARNPEGSHGFVSFEMQKPGCSNSQIHAPLRPKASQNAYKVPAEDLCPSLPLPVTPAPTGMTSVRVARTSEECEPPPLVPPNSPLLPKHAPASVTSLDIFEGCRRDKDASPGQKSKQLRIHQKIGNDQPFHGGQSMPDSNPCT